MRDKNKPENGEESDGLSCSPRYSKGKASMAMMALAAMAMGEGLSGGFPLTGWGGGPARKKKYPDGDCQKCGKKKVRRAREHGECLCFDCFKENGGAVVPGGAKERPEGAKL